jgi:signal transduction histidine kinase
LHARIAVVPSTHDDRELQALYQRGLSERLRRQDHLTQHAQLLRTLAGDDPRWRARAMIVQAYGELYAARVADGEALAREATKILDAMGDAPGAASARDLLAACSCIRGDLAQALALVQPSLGLPPDSRSPLERAIGTARMTVILERLGRHDDALRAHYINIAAARDSGDAAYEAMALGSAGGLQLSLQNLEDAATLCESAWQIVRAQGQDWTNTWSLLAVNWMMVLHFQERHAEVVLLADEIIAAGPRLPASSASKRHLLLAMALAATEQALRLLDAGLRLAPQPQTPPIEWVWTQARLWNDAGRNADALRLCEAHEQAKARGQLFEADTPSDVVGLNTERARAHEGLGDFAAALAAQRRVSAAEREQAGMAIRARRLTLQIQFELESAQRERDHARRREQDAEREQARLAELNAALREADLAKSRFLAAASHDLRQPIHALGLQLAHLRSCVADSESVAITQRMELAIGSLSAMFNTLLDISRMDAGVVAPRMHVLALRPFMARLREEFAPLAQAKGLRLALHVAGRPHTHTDPTLLESMVRNLLSNALKYTERGGVLFALRRTSAGWRVEVWDSGPGIAPEEQERVFEEFYQIGSPSRDRASGMGLGLAIARRLARLLDHPLRLHSTPGHGSRFSIALPHAQAVAPQAPEAAQATPGAGLTIAVIEDDAQVRDSLAGLLRRWGHDVLCAASADELLREHTRAPRMVNAVIADYRLRGAVTGDLQVRQLYDAWGAQPAALIVTGDTAPERLRSLADCGLPWLSKPVQPARLRSWVNSIARACAGH